MALTSHMRRESFARKAFAMAIMPKISWIADEKVSAIVFFTANNQSNIFKESMNYLSELAIGEGDQVVDKRLRTLSCYDSKVDFLKGKLMIDIHFYPIFI